MGAGAALAALSSIGGTAAAGIGAAAAGGGTLAALGGAGAALGAGALGASALGGAEGAGFLGSEFLSSGLTNSQAIQAIGSLAQAGAPGLDAGLQQIAQGQLNTGIPGQAGGFPGGSPAQLAAVSALQNIASPQVLPIPGPTAGGGAPQLNFPRQGGVNALLGGISADPAEAIPAQGGGAQVAAQAPSGGIDTFDPAFQDPRLSGAGASPQAAAAPQAATPQLGVRGPTDQQALIERQVQQELDANDALDAQAAKRNKPFGLGDLLGGPSATTPVKILRALEIAGSIDKGGGAVGASLAAEAKRRQGMDPGVAKAGVGTQQMATAAQAKAASLPEPLRQGAIDLSVKQYALAVNKPENDPAVELFRQMTEADVPPFGGFETFGDFMQSDKPELAAARAAWLSGDEDRIVKEMADAQPALRDIANDNAIAAGAGAEVQRLVSDADDATYKRAGLVKGEPLTEAGVRALNGQVDIHKQVSPNALTAVASDRGASDLAGVVFNEDLETKRNAGIQRRSDVSKKKQTLEAEGQANIKFGDRAVVVTKDGRRRFTDDGFRTMIENGERVPIPDGSVPLDAIKGTDKSVSDVLGTSKPEAKAYRDKLESAFSVTDMIEKLKPKLTEEVLSNPGGLALVANSAKAQAIGFARQFQTKHVIQNPDGSETETDGEGLIAHLSNPENSPELDGWVNHLTSNAKDAAVVRGAIVAITYAATPIIGAGVGRAVSDFDVKQIMKRVGSSADPEVFRAVLTDFEDDVQIRIGNTWDVLTQNGTKGGVADALGPRPDLSSRITGASEPSSQRSQGRQVDGLSKAQIADMTLEEFQSLSPAQRVRMGKRMQVLGLDKR